APYIIRIPVGSAFSHLAPAHPPEAPAKDGPVLRGRFRLVVRDQASCFILLARGVKQDRAEGREPLPQASVKRKITLALGKPRNAGRPCKTGSALVAPSSEWYDKKYLPGKQPPSSYGLRTHGIRDLRSTTRDPDQARTRSSARAPVCHAAGEQRV